MKRLFLTLGLVIAFLISSLPVQASIFDSATYVTPKIDSFKSYDCRNSGGSLLKSGLDIEQCQEFLFNRLNYETEACEIVGCKWFKKDNPHLKVGSCINGQPNCIFEFDLTTYTYTSVSSGGFMVSEYTSKNKDMGYANRLVQSQNKSCPPDEFPNYTFSFYAVGQSEVSKCYNPDELDNISQCANDVGSMLPAITNLSNKVCKTDPVTGASCGYSKKDGDVVYKADLEMNCFGDGEKVPEYDPEPMPQPDTCAKYNDQLMVCKADPKEKCDALGNCGDQCGFVNKELFCFIECTGADCEKETPPPPVNCETNPTAPVCVEEPEPDPDFCKANPTDPKCSTKPPEPCTGDDCGSTGGGGQKVDLKPVVDQLKDLNKKLDFKTSDKSARTDFGGFSDLFSNSDIQAIKKMTDAKKDEITQQITTIKSEFKDMFEVTAVGGAYSDITLSLSMGDFHPQFWSFIQANIGIIGAIVMALAYLMAIRVIAE